MYEAQPSLEGLAITDRLVGPFGINPHEGQQLADWQLPIHLVALQALKNHCSIPTISDNWVPAPDQMHQLHTALSYERRLHGMMSSLKSYVDERPQGTAIARFWKNQQEMPRYSMEWFPETRYK